MNFSPEIVTLETERLLLRQWQDYDIEPFAQLNSDPAVMKYFLRPLSLVESLYMANKCRTLIEQRGWGFWAVELKADGSFIGFVGLHSPEADLPFCPCVEIGWRLSRKFWGNGYATEAGMRALDYGFSALHLDEVVSFATIINTRSIQVMKRLGMRNTGSNFHHPDFPSDSQLSEHVLYKLTQADWLTR